MQFNPLNNMRARPDIVVGPVADIDALHAAAITLGLGQLESTGECGTFWIMGKANDPQPLVMQTRWANESEKRAVIDAFRIALGTSPEIVRYAFLDEVVLATMDVKGKRSDLPADLSEAPDHLDGLMVLAFERTGASRVMIWRWPPGHPEQRAAEPMLTDADSFSGRLWNLFRPPLAH